ncbi:MAG: hypothetical protein CVV02_09175 [Firmicutes bacterium HGW-Firmicutes-7]|nr:MAG: hypothetical protein CVV02_09175 [Firmicutes bacterium HGW-Firmicutes-7]
MSICIVSEKIPPDFSGAGIRVYRQAIEIAARNNQVTILSYTKNDEKNENLTAIQIKVHADVKSKKNYFVKLISLPTIFIQLLMKISKGKFDLVHCVYGAASYLTIFTIIICKILGIKVTVGCTLDGMDDPVHVKKSRFGMFKYFIYKNIDFAVCISPLLVSRHEEVGYDMSKVILIPNSVNMNIFNECRVNIFEFKKDHNILAFDKVLITIGGVIQRKGIMELVSAFDIIKDYGNYALLIIGPTDIEPKYFDEVKNLIEELHLNNRVLLLGKQSNIYDWMVSSDIFVFYSKAEGFGNVYIEAQASGVPIVTKRINGVTEFILENNINGIITDNQVEFVEAVLKLINSKALYNKLKENGKENVRERFSNDVVIDKYIDLFNETIGRNKLMKKRTINNGEV